MSREWKNSAELPWVLEPKALLAFIENERTRVPDSDVALAAYHLSRYVWAKQEEDAKK